MRVIITAGGTGGHIYPAIAIANKIKEKDSKSEILYIGTHNRMEKDLVPTFGYTYESIEVYGYNKTKLFRNIKNIKLMSDAKKKCEKIIKNFKPDVVVGVGGYVTYPVIKAAKKQGVKVFIHEQNSIPGKSNQWLAKSSDIIGVSFEDSIKYFKDKNKCILTGNPCSENAIDLKPLSKTVYGLNRKRKSILMVQGSMGSSALNKKMLNFLSTAKDESYDILYITGKSSYDEFSKNKFSENVYITAYVENLAALMKDFDIVVTRAGASIMSEIISLQKPSIFIPSPYVANNHQYYNAISITNAAAGVMILEDEFSAELLKNKINELITNEQYYKTIQKNLEKISINDSSTRIYKILKELSKNK